MSSLEKKRRLKRIGGKRGNTKIEVWWMDEENRDLFHSNYRRYSDDAEEPDRVITLAELEALPDDPETMRILITWREGPEKT